MNDNISTPLPKLHLSNSNLTGGSILEYFDMVIPVFQSPMDDLIVTPELVAAVTNAGGMGTISGGYLNYDDLRAQIAKVQTLTQGTFAVNLFSHHSEGNFDDEIIASSDHLVSVCNTLNIDALKQEYLNNLPQSLPNLDDKVRCLIEMNVKVVSFTFGIPDERILEILKHAGIIVIGVVTHLLEAILWESKGVKVIILQGLEASGHRATFIGDPTRVMQSTATLISQVKRELPSLYLIASGGIMDAQGIASTQILGADAVMMGTAFLCTPESGASSAYKERLLSANEFDLTLTKSWTGKLGQCLKNTALHQLMLARAEEIAPFPIQHYLMHPIKQCADNADLIALWAGSGFMRCQSESVSTLMSDWMNQLEQFNAR